MNDQLPTYVQCSYNLNFVKYIKQAFQKYFEKVVI